MDNLLHHNAEIRRIALTALKNEIARNQQRNWTEPLPLIDEFPRRFPNWRVQRHTHEALANKFGITVDFPPDSAPVPVEIVRRVMPQRAISFLRRKIEQQTIFLMQVPAGAGKTHAAVEAMQQFASLDSGRILWVAQNHDMALQIEALKNYRRDYWFHWLSMSSDHNDTCKMCRYHKEQAVWMHKGYPSFQLCVLLCSINGYMSNECPYREQSKKANQFPIVFAMHQHLIHGISAGTFQAVVIDELPLNVFVSERVIPKQHINIAGSGCLARLAQKLYEIAMCTDNTAGREFIEQIGNYLSECYNEITTTDVLPQIPAIFTPDDVERVPFFFVFDFLERINSEFHAWRAGWRAWEPRVGIDARGLWMRRRERLWENLPRHIIALDATATKKIYEQIFPDAKLEIYAPAIQRAGQIFQVANRLNGKSSLTDESDLAHENLELVKLIVDTNQYKHVGIVTHKHARGIFELEFGKENVLHFYATRGVNDLQTCDAVFVVGTPSPSNNTLVKQCVTLSDSIELLVTFGGDNKPVMPWCTAQRPYRETDATRLAMDNTIPHRPVSGFWRHSALRALHEQHRVAEIVQAIYRARPLTNRCDVWYLGSLPLDLIAVDRVYGDPSEFLSLPPGITWRNWLVLRPWLNEKLRGGETVTAAMLADICGVSVAYVKNKGWLRGILKIDSRWDIAGISGKNGRPSNEISPII